MSDIAYNLYKDKVRLVEKYNHSYYVLGESLVSDDEYDALIREVAYIEDLHPEWRLDSSPTEDLSSQLDQHVKLVKHGWPMLSMANAYDLGDLVQFITRLAGMSSENVWPVICEHKIDGVAFSARYESGKLVSFATRGDGIFGEDISDKAGFLVPLTISKKQTIEVRGEAVISKETFAILNGVRERQGLTPWMNARNLTAGSLKLKDVNRFAERNVEALCYDVLGDESILSRHDMERWLVEEKFRTVPIAAKCHSIDELKEYIQQTEAKRYVSLYDTDGIVIKVDDYRVRRKIGGTRKVQKWMIAYKFPADAVVTTIKSIELNVGRTGSIIPIANLMPVHISGSIVARCCLYNIQDVMKKDIREGDRVFVEKSGEIIPRIVRVDLGYRIGKHMPKFVIPEECPACHSRLLLEDDVLLCASVDCIGIRKARAIHFLGKQGVDVKGVGPALIHQCFDSGLVNKFIDFFALTKRDISKLDGVGDKKSAGIISALNSKRRIPLSIFLSSISIPLIGAGHCNEIVRHFDGELHRIEQATVDEFMCINGIGVRIAVSLYDFLRSFDYECIKDGLIRSGVVIVDERMDAKRHVHEKVVVLSGEMHRPRTEISRLLAERGYHVAASVSKKTDFLVIGDNPGSKLDKAKALGIKVVEEKEFFDVISPLLNISDQK